jgi:hypothetical protein
VTNTLRGCTDPKTASDVLASASCYATEVADVDENTGLPTRVAVKGFENRYTWTTINGAQSCGFIYPDTTLPCPAYTNLRVTKDYLYNTISGEPKYMTARTYKFSTAGPHYQYLGSVVDQVPETTLSGHEFASTSPGTLKKVTAKTAEGTSIAYVLNKFGQVVQQTTSGSKIATATEYMNVDSEGRPYTISSLVNGVVSLKYDGVAQGLSQVSVNQRVLDIELNGPVAKLTGSFNSDEAVETVVEVQPKTGALKSMNVDGKLARNAQSVAPTVWESPYN